jgi:hypothetical protein
MNCPVCDKVVFQGRYHDECRESYVKLRQERDELKEEVTQWKANHTDMVMRNRALHDRPDLKERAATVDALYHRAEKAEADSKRFREALYQLLNDCINFDGGKLSDCKMRQATEVLNDIDTECKEG